MYINNVPNKKSVTSSLVGGFSLIEIIVVVAIIGVLFVIVASQVGLGQMDKARDAKRKDSLKRIKIAFEEYYNDNNDYPPNTILDDCDGNDLVPYLSKIPCDPANGTAYEYVPDPSGGYRIYALLERESDPVIRELGCEGGCPLAPSYNYVVFEGVGVNN